MHVQALGTMVLGYDTTASLLILWLAILQADYATKHKNRGKGKVLIKRYDGLFPHFCN